MATLNTSIGNLQDSDDISKVKSYLYRLNEQLRYMFDNLTPEENFSPVAYLAYKEEGDKISKMEITVDGITSEVYDAQGNSKIAQNASQIALKVNTSDLGNSSLTIKPAKIELQTTGQLVISSGNFTLDSHGNANFKGAINSGSTITASAVSGGTINGTHISGSTIETRSGMFYASSDDVYIGPFYVYDGRTGTYLANYDQTMGMGNSDLFAFWAGGSGSYPGTNPKFTVQASGRVYGSDFYPNTAGSGVYEHGLGYWVDYIFEELGL